jgi:hypothetical protein
LKKQGRTLYGFEGQNNWKVFFKAT